MQALLWLWLWLWCRPEAITLIRPLAWEFSNATRLALESKKEKKKRKRNSAEEKMKRNSRASCLVLPSPSASLRTGGRQRRPGRQRLAGFPEAMCGMGARNQAKLLPAVVAGHLCLKARNHSSERFRDLPEATQPNLESQVSPRIFQTPSQVSPPLL